MPPGSAPASRPLLVGAAVLAAGGWALVRLRRVRAHAFAQQQLALPAPRQPRQLHPRPDRDHASVVAVPDQLFDALPQRRDQPWRDWAVPSRWDDGDLEEWEQAEPDPSQPANWNEDAEWEDAEWEDDAPEPTLATETDQVPQPCETDRQAEPDLAPQPEPFAPETRLPRHARQRGMLERLGQVADLLLAFAAATLIWLSFIAFTPTLFGWDSRVVISGSMTPRINTGDVVVIQKTTNGLAPGGLVTFHDQAQPGRIMTHRLVRQLPNGQWITKGDANASQDSTPVPVSAVIGRPRLVVPLVGLPTYWRAAGEYPTTRLVMGATALLVLLGLRTAGAQQRDAARRGRVASTPTPVQLARLLPRQRQPGARRRAAPGHAAPPQRPHESARSPHDDSLV